MDYLPMTLLSISICEYLAWDILGGSIIVAA